MERNSYKVIGKISDGGFGEIFKVKSLKSNEFLALKHIKYRGSFSDQNYIKNEISSLSSLNHENIISFCDVIIKSRDVNIIMEYADGGNLEEYVGRMKKLQTSVISDIFIQILHAVGFCHEQLIAHRDLTPSNVLLTSNRIVKLADFGLSMKCKNADGEKVLCDDFLGNKLYLAPEVIRECVHDAILADLWSLGVLLFFIVFADVPFCGFDDEILVQQQTIRNTLLTLSNENVAEFHINVILDLLQFIPNDRLTVNVILNSWRFNKNIKM